MNSFWITFNGKSMHPFLRDEDELFVTEASSWKTGDIVLYKDRASGELTVHRIISDNLQTKGDFSLCLDGNTPEDFLGKVMAVKRKGVVFKLQLSETQGSVLAFFSRLRLKGWWLRKIGLTGLFFLSFWKSRENHKSELH